MHLIEPHGHKRKWDIRLRNHDGRIVKIPGDVDPTAAKRIGERVVMLVKAKQNGDPPPAELATWLRNLRPQLQDRLIELGLIPSYHFTRKQPLSAWVEQWEQVVGGRRPDSMRHAPQQGRKVRRIIEAIEATAVDELEADVVVEAINGLKTLGTKNPKPLATSSRRGYGIAVKDFAHWLAKKLKIENPLEAMELPGQYENPEYERQPLTVTQFQALMASSTRSSGIRARKRRGRRTTAS